MENTQAPEWRHEYNEGWDNLVDTLVSKLHAIDPDMQIAQIKEKFGGLRAYIDHSMELNETDATRFQALIREAEDASYAICDRCGGTGRTISLNGWYMTVCEEDEAKIIENRRIYAEKAKIENERLRKEEEALKVSTVCMECGNEGIWRQDMRVKTTVLCDDHYAQWQEEMKKRRKQAEAIRAEILARKNTK